MIFNSLEEIIEYYGIDTNDIDIVRKKLKAELIILHPDKSGGEFANKKQEKDYQDLNSALEYLDSLSSEVTISRQEWSLVVKQINELSRLRHNVSEESEQKYLENLNRSIDTSVLSYVKRHSFFKISSLALTGLLTILWSFPAIAENHSVLKHYVSAKNPIFSIIWICTLMSTILFWILVKNLEGKDEQIKKTYNLDSTQNLMFKLFISWLKEVNYDSVDYDHDNHSIKVCFSKDDLINFITNYYHFLTRRTNVQSAERQRDIDTKVSKEIKDNPFFDEGINSKRSIVTYLFKKPGDIDIDLGQKLTEMIIEKLLIRGIILVNDERSFSQKYTYEYKYIG